MPRTHADYVRAGKLGWGRSQTRAARRSLAGVKSWRGRRSSAVQKRAEAESRGRLGPLVKTERAFERLVTAPPVPAPPFEPQEIHALVRDAAWSALTDDIETALTLAEEALAAAGPGYLFAVNALYVFPDGETQWISLSALSPLEGLGVALLAMLEKSSVMLKRGHTPGAETEDAEGEVREEPSKLEEVSVYLTDGKWMWRG